MAKTFQYKPGQDLTQATASIFKQIDETLESPEIQDKISTSLTSLVSMIQSDMVDLISLEGRGDIMGTLDEIISMSHSQMALVTTGRKFVQKGELSKSDWDKIKNGVDAIIDITKAWMQNAFLGKNK